MKSSRHSSSRLRAFTLLEMTIVMLISLTLISVGVFSSRKMGEWKLGREAGETLRMVYSAQRMYLADNPTKLVDQLTHANLVPYLPNGVTTMPTVESLTGANLTILVNVSPPVINAGSGETYDPSGSYTDSIWDVGE